MRVAVCVPIWGREQLTRACMSHWRRVGVDLAYSGYDIRVCVVGSEGKSEIATRDGHEYVEFSNDSFALKLDAGLGLAKTLEPDAVMFSGSDDFLSAGLVEGLLEELGSSGAGHVGVLDALFLDLSTMRIVHWPGYTDHRKGESIGCGRTIKRGVLDDLGWKIWSDCTSAGGIDGWMKRKLEELSCHPRNRSTAGWGGTLICPKALGQTINAFASFADCPDASLDALLGLGDETRRGIMACSPTS